MNENRLLKNIDLNAQIMEQGYVTIPFLNESELQCLRQEYHSNHPNGPEWYREGEGIHMTTWVKDFDYKLRISEALKSIFKGPVQKSFNEVRCLNQVFIVKQPGAHTSFKVHQDWSIVDESKFLSVNVWIPLHDVDKTTGALWVIPGSHKTKRKIRGAGYLFPNYSDHFKALENMALNVPLKAGEAVVFFHSIIHGSPPNLGMKDRVVACFGAIPKEVPLQIYFQSDAQSPLEVHNPIDDFIIRYENLREESILKAPTVQPSALLKPLENITVNQAEIEVLEMNSRRLQI